MLGAKRALRSPGRSTRAPLPRTRIQLKGGFVLVSLRSSACSTLLFSPDAVQTMALTGERKHLSARSWERGGTNRCADPIATAARSEPAPEVSTRASAASRAKQDQALHIKDTFHRHTDSL